MMRHIMNIRDDVLTSNSPFQQYFEKGIRSIKSLMQNFGEMCITTYMDDTHQAKLTNHGSPGIWVDYADGHPTGTYWIFNPKAKKIAITRDVTFLRKSYRD